MSIKEVVEKSPFLKGIIIIALAVVMGIVMGTTGLVGLILGTFLVFLATVLVLYLMWAPVGIFAFFLEEGYAKIVVRGESFHEAYIKTAGKVLSVNYDVVDEGAKVPLKEEPSTLFGMVFLFWPFYRVYTYKQKWVKFKDGMKQKREEVLNHVLLMAYVYYVEVLNAETYGKISVNMGIAVEAKIVNPYKAMFMIKDWNAAMTSWIEGATRDFVSKNSYEEIIRGDLASQLKAHILKQISDDLRNYGVVIVELTVIHIEPADKEYEEATKAQVIEARKREATITRARADAEKESIARMESVIFMVAASSGQTVDALKAELLKNPGALSTKYRVAYEAAMALVNKNMAIAGNSYLEINTGGGSGSGGGSGFNEMLTAIVAANKILNQGQGQQQKPIEKSSKKKINKKEEDYLLSGNWLDDDDE
jgi:hypothetical protein